MKCTNCGLELPPGSKFCERCGYRKMQNMWDGIESRICVLREVRRTGICILF